jgi:hypothetical protein
VTWGWSAETWIYAESAETGGGDTYELVTAFELFEHLAHPLNRPASFSQDKLFSNASLLLRKKYI